MKMFKDEVVKLSTEMYIDGNESRVLTYAGVKYYEPVFMGQSIGVVQEVLKDGKKYYCLIKSPDAGNEWLTISRADLINFRVGVPKKGTPIYFCILTKNRKRRNSVPYWICELCYYPRHTNNSMNIVAEGN